MTTLLAVGLGYCARHFLAAFPATFDRVIGTARTPEGVAKVQDAGFEGVLFDGTSLTPALADAVAAADVLLLSAPPEANGDPLLAVARAALTASPALKQIIYLTTLGVYGDHQGGWVDEDTPPKAGSARLERRLAAEANLLAFGAARGIPVAVLRLAGIYGPGRNAFVQVLAGEARRIEKPDQVFNRIHVDDISTTIAAVLAQRFGGLLNVTDDLPAPPGDPIVFAAGLLGLAPPPAISFSEAAKTMSPMALSFWGASKRVRNTRLKAALGVHLAYPTYAEGLSSLHKQITAEKA
ncbi:SDR family oxidoreductase [Azorhizobium sp. AG788]|uniref:SDR family oxidoreductase n=1 Tax=Azorhizobium sp. AG788 TaxID=2183897 RepID=UPI0031394B07